MEGTIRGHDDYYFFTPPTLAQAPMLLAASKLLCHLRGLHDDLGHDELCGPRSMTVIIIVGELSVVCKNRLRESAKPT